MVRLQFYMLHLQTSAWRTSCTVSLLRKTLRNCSTPACTCRSTRASHGCLLCGHCLHCRPEKPVTEGDTVCVCVCVCVRVCVCVYAYVCVPRGLVHLSAGGIGTNEGKRQARRSRQSVFRHTRTRTHTHTHTEGSGAST
jgi:hypothetical protein